MGGKVPETYYFSRNKPVPTSDMVSAIVPSGNKLKIKFEINSPVILKWEFFTEEDDIGIEIYYKKNSKKIEVIPLNESIQVCLCMKVKLSAKIYIHMYSFSTTLSAICGPKKFGIDSPSLT